MAQGSGTVSGGLNQNPVNVVRDGDLPESSSGVIRMAPAGRKGKVMKMVPDSTVQPPAAETPSFVPQDSTIRMNQRTAVKKRNTRVKKQVDPR